MLFNRNAKSTVTYNLTDIDPETVIQLAVAMATGHLTAEQYNRLSDGEDVDVSMPVWYDQYYWHFFEISKSNISSSWFSSGAVKIDDPDALKKGHILTAGQVNASGQLVGKVLTGAAASSFQSCYNKFCRAVFELNDGEMPERSPAANNPPPAQLSAPLQAVVDAFKLTAVGGQSSMDDDERACMKKAVNDIANDCTTMWLRLQPDGMQLSLGQVKVKVLQEFILDAYGLDIAEDALITLLEQDADVSAWLQAVAEAEAQAQAEAEAQAKAAAEAKAAAKKKSTKASPSKSGSKKPAPKPSSKSPAPAPDSSSDTPSAAPEKPAAKASSAKPASSAGKKPAPAAKKPAAPAKPSELELVIKPVEPAEPTFAADKIRDAIVKAKANLTASAWKTIDVLEKSGESWTRTQLANFLKANGYRLDDLDG